jgi:pimeloyl-ACP methyl ester carboxylesterase
MIQKREERSNDDAAMIPSSIPLLLLPGLLCDARIWAPQSAAFADREVVVADYGDANSLVEMATRTLASAPAVFSLAGHSMGARVALEIYRIAPERVARLAILSSGVHLPKAGEAEKRHALLELGRREGSEALVDAWLPPMVLPERRTPELMAMLTAMCVDAGVDTYAAQIAALLGRPEVESLLPTIACPTLVAVGRGDTWAPPSQHEAIAAMVPGAELTIFEDCGHMCLVEAPDQVNAALSAWLERA